LLAGAPEFFVQNIGRRAVLAAVDQLAPVFASLLRCAQ
jgi:hypothetical protein